MPDATPSTPDLAPAALETWLRLHPRRVTGALAGAAIFVRLILCLQAAATPLTRIDTLVAESDNHFFDEWGRQIAGGDWLQRAPLHPTTRWMRQVADQALARDPELPVKLGLAPDAGYDRPAMEVRLWERWLGGATFFQEPAYAYLVGLTYGLFGANVWHVFLLQLALGVCGVLLVHELARRLFSETAAAAAGVLALLAPIPLLYEITLLRDSLVAVLTVALALAMHWAPGGRRVRWLILGLAFGGATLVKQSFLFFPMLMAAWRLATVRAPLRERLAAAGLVTAGLGIALLPAVLRNVAVGVPALALNGSAAGMLAMFHTASASPIALTVPPEFSRVLVAADGRPLASFVEAARTHPSPWGFVALNLRKLLYVWHGYEAGNNVDVHLFKLGAPLLAALPATFVVLVPLAGVGLASRGAARAWPLLVAIAASIPTMLLAAVLSRYRAAVAIALLPLAGAGLVRASGWIAARRWRPVAWAAAVSALYLAWATRSLPGKAPAEEGAVYASDGLRWLDRGEPAYAALHLEESLRLVPHVPQVEALLGRALLDAGDAPGAITHLDAAARSLDSPRFRELHAVALAAVGRRDEALASARAALRADPDRAAARALLEAPEGGARSTSLDVGALDAGGSR
ncbi:glycosyltransferase family 39 protein [Anaeromyxobacter oryzae]|uniref:Glycosyltransferase RgtA/B/C/D-like domain-containing protein n=1 Tax=Anaeromyxobacter oryzae TaxID=2918170 RepID=A0ABM7WXN7_9BACT|nr:glycosyltransferase family 39 protein [Anaeromyxobacter oryzae]BDG04285.1 hypothetical protein AMOR_32810 [Anaeromyxobacter oryzae]